MNSEVLKIEDDEVNNLLRIYKNEIAEHCGNNIALSFFANSERYVDEYTPLKGIDVKNVDHVYFGLTYLNDYSIGEKTEVYDCGLVKLREDGKEYTFFKFVTPFTRQRTYDFLVMKTEEASEILNTLKKRKSSKDFVFNDFPIVGLDFDDIRKNTVDFLLNEDFREYCKSKYIKLKRGIILEGKPGTGKTLTLQWLKNIALDNDIEFHSFKNVDDFVKNQDDYYDDNKKIFVFEDFDTLLRERKDVNFSPNTVLGMILNTLEGVNEINNVVSIFTTNEVKVFDSAFIRPGRIDKVYTYSLPNKETYLEFFKAYIPEEEEYFDYICEFLDATDTSVSFAILKGICDDVNIFKFSGEELTKEKIHDIIKEKLNSANKKQEVKNYKDHIL